MYKEFLSPPKGYGNVPFYWWSGDRLEEDRIAYQLEKLAENGVSGVQINFAHHCPAHRPDMAGGGFGKTYACDPEAFSSEWWDIVNFTFRKAKSLGMGVGISDYTMGWIGNGYFVDKVVFDAKLRATELFCEKTELKKGEKYNVTICSDTLNITVVYSNSEETVTSDFIAKSDCTVCRVYKKINEKSINVLDPAAGKFLTEQFFEYFENNLDDDVKDALNYCFQDEFIPGCDTSRLWSDTLDAEFKTKKGYDIKPSLHEIFVGTETCVKTRLDYADIKAGMIEEGYFKPLYEFHEKRGLIYGCDQCGRGTSPDEYGDYFRTIRWFSAPGNDTPLRRADLIKDKVNSSVAHLYRRPRTWLEGYHSSGWGTSLDSLTAPTSDNFVYGMNLLCMHGLYYSTYGGFWEWAPPDFHFRMPYWAHAKSFYNYYERLAYLLTRGTHACDVAVFYPVSSCDAALKAGNAVKSTFTAASHIFENGIDFDFIDHQSIEAAEIIDGKLCVSGEKYSVILLASVDVIRSFTLEKIVKFAENGGKLIIFGESPLYTDKLHDPLLENLPAIKANTTEELISAINKYIKRDFYTADETRANVLHRTSAEFDIYFVRNAKKDTVCSFKAEGTPELWFAEGKERRLLNYMKNGEYTEISLPSDGDNLIIFNRTPDKAVKKYAPLSEPVSVIPIDGEWDFELVPTLDNTYGDFRLPVEPDEKLIGAEIRFPLSNGKKATISEYAPFNKTTPDGKVTETVINDRYGIVTGASEEQGYHGLKKQVYDWNILIKKGEKAVYSAYFTLKNECEIEILTDGLLPNVTMIDENIIRDFSSVKLTAGTHRLSVEYINNENSIFGENGKIIGDRAYLVLKNKNEEESPAELPLINRWFANKGIIRTAAEGYIEKAEVTAGIAPGTEQLKAVIFGTLDSAEINSTAAKTEKIGEKHGANVYKITAEKVNLYAGEIRMEITPLNGYTSGAIFAEPIKERCRKAKIKEGDVSLIGGLESYSGMFRYRKTVNLSVEAGKRHVLNLGKVACSCKITVNGKEAAVICSAPFKTEITDFITDGDNEIEIEIANTLCNHYSTNPSPYSNYPKDAVSGLIGPVTAEEY